MVVTQLPSWSRDPWITEVAEYFRSPSSNTPWGLWKPVHAQVFPQASEYYLWKPQINRSATLRGFHLACLLTEIEMATSIRDSSAGPSQPNTTSVQVPKEDELALLYETYYRSFEWTRYSELDILRRQGTFVWLAMPGIVLRTCRWYHTPILDNSKRLHGLDYGAVVSTEYLRRWWWRRRLQWWRLRGGRSWRGGSWVTWLYTWRQGHEKRWVEGDQCEKGTLRIGKS